MLTSNQQFHPHHLVLNSRRAHPYEPLQSPYIRCRQRHVGQDSSQIYQKQIRLTRLAPLAATKGKQVHSIDPSPKVSCEVEDMVGASLEKKTYKLEGKSTQDQERRELHVHATPMHSDLEVTTIQSSIPYGNRDAQSTNIGSRSNSSLANSKTTTEKGQMSDRFRARLMENNEGRVREQPVI